MSIAKLQFGTIALAALRIALACGGSAARAQTADHYQNFNTAIAGS
jgi:hypothetical protein